MRDSKIAPLIQSLIQKFLCPWYRLRAKTIFRDLACLPAGSSLEAELFDRLDRSTHLIVLASPDAATSDGMEMEARHWISKPRNGEVLIIITAGEGDSWQEIRQRLLPPSLRHHLVTTPLWVSLRGRRSGMLEKRRSAALREELVEDLKQILLRFYPDRDWSQLRGQERAQRRLLLATLSSASLLFLVLAALAILFAVYARREQRVAESRSLAAQAEQVLSRDRASALSIAFRSWQTSRTREANDAIADIYPQLVATLGIDDTTVFAVFSPNSRMVLTRSSGGSTNIWNALDGRRQWVLKDGTDSKYAAFSPDSRRIVTAGFQGVRIFDSGDGRFLRALGSKRAEWAVFSPDGGRIVTAGAEGASVWDAATGAQLLSIAPGKFVDRAVFSPDGERIMTTGHYEPVRVWNAVTGEIMAEFETHEDSTLILAAFSPDGTAYRNDRP